MMRKRRVTKRRVTKRKRRLVFIMWVRQCCNTIANLRFNGAKDVERSFLRTEASIPVCVEHVSYCTSLSLLETGLGWDKSCSYFMLTQQCAV